MELRKILQGKPFFEIVYSREDLPPALAKWPLRWYVTHFLVELDRHGKKMGITEIIGPRQGDGAGLNQDEDCYYLVLDGHLAEMGICTWYDGCVSDYPTWHVTQIYFRGLPVAAKHLNSLFLKVAKKTGIEVVASLQ